MFPSVAPDRYKVLRLLGRGGMGAVYSAFDTQLERNVALKVVRASSAEEEGSPFEPPESVMRMMREARAAAALEHANIVTIYDVGQTPIQEGEEPSCFIAMELVEGRRLRDYVGRKDVPLETRVAWLGDVARALAFAHERGIIHRDIKPENVMIRDDGVVKVLDFGLARRAGGALPLAGNVALPTLTERGSVLGTVLYMAPEQMCGVELDGRVDQFAWGVMAYELIAGKPLWPGGADSIQIVANVFTREPASIRSVEPNISEALGSIVDRAVARNREDRFPSMSALLEALDPFVVSSRVPRRALAATSGLVEVPPQAAPPPPRDAVSRSARVWRRLGARWRFAALAVVLIGGGAPVSSAIIAHRRDAAMAPPACSQDAECGPGGACRRGQCEHRSGCRSNAECTRSAGGPAICRTDTGGCVALASPDCHAVAEPGDLQSDATVWFGAMFPLVGAEAASFGKREFQAVDLARADFAYMLRGTHAGPEARDVRPIALVACDDSVDASRAASHLVDDVGVPAIIGFRTSKEVIDLATSTFIPRDVLTIAALNTSPIIASLPRAANQPRMVFRTTYSSAQAAAPIGLLVSEVLEPEIRAAAGAAHGGEALRVALVRQDDAAGIGFADVLFRTLRYNGRSALENEANYHEFPYPFDTKDGKPADFGGLSERLASFAPHIVIHFGADEAFLQIVDPLERSWKASSPRPRYVKPTAFAPPVLAYAAHRPDRRRRFFAITSTSMTAANARFVARYAEAYASTVTRTFSPNSSYDAFYLLAYATYALGREPVTGPGLARMIGRLLPPGRPIDVGPNGIFDALNKLAAGEHIDLNGATGPLDFDLETGEAPVDLAVLCVKAEPDGTAPQSVESGLTYDASAGALRGAMHCP